MNIVSCYKLLLILITQAIHFSEQIKHINKSSSNDACKGKDVDLIWKVNEEKNSIRKLEWYFNNKTICTSSPVEAFTVEPPYQGRIERIGKTEIRLKNVSIEDEGIYILFPLFLWSTSQNMPKIVRILEPPTNKCTCNIGHPPDFTFEQTESYCGRPQVSLVWKRKQTFEVLGEGNHTLNSTLQDKEVLCCQNGEAMKCVDDNRQFCTTVSIPHQDTERPSEDGNTQHTDSVTMPGTGSTNIQHMQPFLVLATLTVCLLTTLLVLVLFIINCKKRKKNKDLEEKNCELHNAVKPLIEDEPSLETKEAITVHQPTNDSEANIELQPLQHSALYPVLEKEAMLHEHQRSPSLETMKGKEMQELHQAALYPVLEKAVMLHEHQRNPSLETMKGKEMQELRQAALYPVLEKAVMLHEHQRSPSLETMKGKEMQELRQAALYTRLETPSTFYEHQHSRFLETMKQMRELHQAALCKICFVKEICVVFLPCNHSVTCAYCSMPLKQCPFCGVLIKMKMNICSD